MTHFRIRYLDSNGKETTPDMAVVFRVFKNGEHVKDFFPLSAAYAYIVEQRAAELIEGLVIKTLYLDRRLINDKCPEAIAVEPELIEAKKELLSLFTEAAK